MKITKLLVSTLTPLAVLPSQSAVRPKPNERPNILWLSFEDTSPYELGCYGNRHASTPVIDSLAANGIQFMNAYSCGPQSSPSRSTLITGCYSTTYAMDWHRCRVQTPENILFPQYLRNAGYYCTNNKKTDYNTKIPNDRCWDECDDNASYNSPKRAENQPFFAVFNSNLTHMSRLTSVHTDGRRNFAKEGLAPEQLELPPHVPDLPEVRSDYAFHIEGVNDVDRWVGLFMKDLQEKGLAENTVIFVFSDHGGCLPRGKAFSYETSFRVPMVVYLPPKWAHLSKITAGTRSERLVSFADMGATMLSLAGIKPAEYMQGLPFLGRYDKAQREYQIGYMTNRTIHFAPSRSISDGHFKYIRYYIPYKKDDLFNYFQWQMPANLYWEKAYFEGRITAEKWKRPFEYSPAESFYDLDNDPFELNDLVADSRYASEMDRLKKALSKHIRDTKDIGFLETVARNNAVPFDRVREKDYDLEKLYRLVELTATVAASDIPYLNSIIKGNEPEEFKYWAVVNLAVLAVNGMIGDQTEGLSAMLSCNDEQAAQEAAFALCHTDRSQEGFDYLAAHPELTSALEMLSLDPQMRGRFPQNVLNMLHKASDSFEHKKRSAMPGANDGVGERKVLVNLGEIPADSLYGSKVYEIGRKVNRTNRKLVPLP